MARKPDHHDRLMARIAALEGRVAILEAKAHPSHFVPLYGLDKDPGTPRYIPVFAEEEFDPLSFSGSVRGPHGH